MRREFNASCERLVVERLESRICLTVRVAAFDAATRMVRFEGDQDGSTADQLTLRIDKGMLCHDAGAGTYSGCSDLDSGASVGQLSLSGGTSFRIEIALGIGNDAIVILEPRRIFTRPVLIQPINPIGGSLPRPATVMIDGGGGDDTLTFTTQSLTRDLVWNIDGESSGTIGSSLQFTSFENLQGGSQNDVFRFDESDRVAGSLNGGFGVNTVDYSAFKHGCRRRLGGGNRLGRGVALQFQQRHWRVRRRHFARRRSRYVAGWQ